jgi:hypothetical protein
MPLGMVKMANGMQNPLADRNDQPCCFSDGNELVWGDQSQGMA